jgi:RNA polymerase subunit RPABC4/transcription elongation factor Spt4
MWLEVVAAALVGVSLLWLVFEPLFTTASPRAVGALDFEALEEAEDTRSGVALTALREIEFDRETGKLSDDDYTFLKQKYTVEALSALRSESADAGPEVEAQVAARVAAIRAEAEGAPTCSGCGAGVEPGARFCPSCGTPLGRPRACANCGSELPAGSRFCAACGGRVAA